MPAPLGRINDPKGKVLAERNAPSIRILVYDGQGFWLAQKRLSRGRFPWRPTANEPSHVLQAHQAQLLLAAGDPDVVAARSGGVLARKRSNTAAFFFLRSGFGSATLSRSGAYRGRLITSKDVAFIRHSHPEATRRALSAKLCKAWHWKQANGALRDLACCGHSTFLRTVGIDAPTVVAPMGPDLTGQNS